MAKSPLIVNENSNHSLPYPRNVQVSGRSSGGGNFLLRAAKFALDNHERHVYVCVSPGEKQDVVTEAIKQQYMLMNTVGKTNFTITIVKEDACVI
jgi:hypothetical protein